ncbi:hypothetical protein ERO13_D06G010368v2 [Gossypium hirsutum]|uniref:Secreted protein n=4 Tax=Gossypium TaxID=3633 RepID=A0A5J5QWE8_GOSBA|nr:hypothetical protein ES319_D06G013700v1 [Gossypium barbadense]KAG4140316.1 hypothetical protein ERO13_D06G010368v2 [Gossypium hirsutum]TYG63254.1 hypothetical protein ES288_D06G014300v1 [Gossypium darwinii]TYH64874.1 hypothetical protein ES332_D06G016400v1 [Gossypium tomentosum]TYI75566.1 hypothetical protein E1A91_D06G014400v1 [Gossypium mustelinum]
MECGLCWANLLLSLSYTVFSFSSALPGTSDSFTRELVCLSSFRSISASPTPCLKWNLLFSPAMPSNYSLTSLNLRAISKRNMSGVRKEKKAVTWLLASVCRLRLRASVLKSSSTTSGS